MRVTLQNGWIKLHRKLLDNPLFKKDANALLVFVKLLLIVDRKTGSYNIGRFQMAELTGLKPTTAYKVLKRIEKHEMVTLRSNNKYTTISICKWKSYQDTSNSDGDNKVTTKGQQSNTKQEGKKVRSKKVLNKLSTTENKDPQITSLISHFEKSIGKMPRPANQAYAAISLISDHGYERTIGAINAVAACRGEPFAPSIASLEELSDKWIKLETFYKRKQSKGVIEI